MTDWHRKTIGDLCHFSSGHGFTPRDWANKGLPIIRIQNLNGSQKFNYYDGKPEPSWIVEPGELLYAWAGVAGVSFGPTIWQGPRGVLNQHIYRVTPKDGVDPDWLHAALKVVTSRIERKAHGFKGSLLHVHKQDITNQHVYQPKIEEQKEISRILAVTDRSIDLTEQLLVCHDQRRQWLMQQLLTGKRRLRGFRYSWFEKTFGDYLKESREQGSCGEKAKKLTVKLYARGVVAKEEKSTGSESTKYFVRRKGQFIYSKLDFLNGAFGLIPEELDGYETTLDLPAFDISPEMNSRWLLYYVSREQFYSQQLSLANGGRKARRVNPSDFLGLNLRVPHRDEQDEIVRALSIADRELTLLRSQLDALREQKKGLMQQLLTGKVRVKV